MVPTDDEKIGKKVAGVTSVNKNSYRVALDFTGVLKTTAETHTAFRRGTEQRPRYKWQKL